MIFSAIDLLALAKTSIQNLFDINTNSTRLVQPSGGASIEDAINTAADILAQVKALNQSSNEVQSLTQSLGFAKGLNMLTPYFTDLSMNTPSSSKPTSTDISTTNSSINGLGLSDPGYLQILYDLLASLSSPLESTVLRSNKTISILA